MWNGTLAQVAIDYGFTVELCTPRQPQQKGSVENLVGFVKRSFFRARRFQDLERDLPEQLVGWLTEVNTVRPCRATRAIPAARLPAEQARLKPLVVAPAAYGLCFPVTVGPTAMVTYQSLRYAMPAAVCGLPATLWPYPDRLKIVTAGSRHEAVHPRFPTAGSVSYLPGQRAAQLAAVAGARKRLYFMRERLLELGPVGEAYLTELIHQRPQTWKGDVERLFASSRSWGMRTSGPSCSGPSSSACSAPSTSCVSPLSSPRWPREARAPPPGAERPGGAGPRFGGHAAPAPSADGAAPLRRARHPRRGGGHGLPRLSGDADR